MGTMNRINIALGKDSQEKAPQDNSLEGSDSSADNFGIRTGKVGGGKNLLIRGPGGTLTIIPIRFIEVEVRQKGIKEDLILTLPGHSAESIAQDIKKSQRL